MLEQTEVHRRSWFLWNSKIKAPHYCDGYAAFIYGQGGLMRDVGAGSELGIPEFHPFPILPRQRTSATLAKGARIAPQSMNPGLQRD